MTSFSMQILSYSELGRFNRPIGAWLLFFPCAWGVMAGATHLSDLIFIPLFLIGAFVMRGAGCTINDIVDRQIDARVERTQTRPLASQKLSLKQAYFFLSLQLFLGLFVLLQLPFMALVLGLVTLPLITAYPFMKRVIPFPQLILGLCFNSGALIGYAAVQGTLDFVALSLYIAGIFWTLCYDTIYAHQDKKDDEFIGVKSTALLFGKLTKPFLLIFYVMMLAALSYAGFWSHEPFVYFGALGFLSLYFLYEIFVLNLDQPEKCLKAFKDHFYVGFFISLALALKFIV
jgi:4-hydroxybenzoate polyprenyl transferase